MYTRSCATGEAAVSVSKQLLKCALDRLVPVLDGAGRRARFEDAKKNSSQMDSSRGKRSKARDDDDGRSSKRKRTSDRAQPVVLPGMPGMPTKSASSNNNTSSSLAAKLDGKSVAAPEWSPQQPGESLDESQRQQATARGLSTLTPPMETGEDDTTTATKLIPGPHSSLMSTEGEVFSSLPF